MFKIMDPRFLAHNSHLEGVGSFHLMDPHLRYLSRQPFVFQSPLLDQLPVDTPGVYTVSGGRQIGKTTALKQWMRRLMHDGVNPVDIAFFTGELIDDHHTLVNLVTAHLQNRTSCQYVIVDEVGYIRDWDKGIKFLADAGYLMNVELVLTGSDSVLIQEARLRFPGRRGNAEKVDFVVTPLSFRQAALLKNTIAPEEAVLMDAAPGGNTVDDGGIHGQPLPPGLVSRLFQEFERYMAHGGFLTAINDLQINGSILPATLRTYSDWIRGDFVKRGRQEAFLKEILASVLRHQGSQLSWHNLARDMSIEHPQTVADYVALLASMDVLLIQPALLEDKLVEAPRKPRKLHFRDPFIRHAVRYWLDPSGDPYHDGILADVSDSVASSVLAESVAVSHVARNFPTFYIKAAGEVDIAWVEGSRFFPVEVKWTGQLRSKELQQVRKYPNARIWSRQPEYFMAGEIPVEPLPLALWRMG